MGIRGEIFSTKVMLQNRTYFFNVKENRMGDLYLNIVESKNRDTGGFERQSVILFAEDLQDFLRGFDDSLRVLEKALRERKRSGGRRDRSGEDYGESRANREAGNRENYSRENYGDKARYGGDRGSGKYDGERRGSKYGGDRGGPGGRENFRHDRDGEYHGDRDIPARKTRRLVAKKTGPRDKEGERDAGDDSRRKEDPSS
jgi:hypothetical protein